MFNFFLKFIFTENREFLMQCAVHCILGVLLRDRLHRAAGLPHEEKIIQKEGVGSVKILLYFAQFFPVFRIRIHMFLGPPDPDPFVRGMDPDPFVIMQK
jgi:hypothetical protein